MSLAETLILFGGGSIIGAMVVRAGGAGRVLGVMCADLAALGREWRAAWQDTRAALSRAAGSRARK